VDPHLVLASRRDTVRLGGRIAAALRAGDLVLLCGELGAGKTFLARAVVRALGIAGDLAVASPTFGIVHDYETAQGEVVHADFYRLLDGPTPLDVEIGRLGLRERRRGGAILLAEWAEDSEQALGGDAELVVTLGIQGAHARQAVLRGARADQVA
jgi:tRNA threonylcarbamoyladenosine biosynthesis protein TsaE